jgi:hypothetical protein|eukprot:COSAG01_NODE_47_length_32024_cov_1294.553579_2_plen_116_part_00
MYIQKRHLDFSPNCGRLLVRVQLDQTEAIHWAEGVDSAVSRATSFVLTLPGCCYGSLHCHSFCDSPKSQHSRWRTNPVTYQTRPEQLYSGNTYVVLLLAPYLVTYSTSTESTFSH